MHQGKIIHLLTSLKLGGAESLVVELAELQAKNGLDVEIISLGHDDEHFTYKAKRCGVPVTTLGFLNFWQRNQLLKKRFADAKVVHIHSPWGLRQSIIALLIARDARVIYTRHGNGYYANLIWRGIHTLLESRIHAITFVSAAGPKIFQQWHKWPEQKIHVIENGVSIPPMKARPITDFSQRKFRLGSVGRMVPLKAQDDLLKAFMLLNDSDRQRIEIHFFGTGECEQSLRAMSHSAKLPTYFHGSISDVNTIYEQIDVLVVTSQNEGLSMAIMEAMARAIPIIATEVGGNPSLVKDQKTGILVPYGKPEQLAESIQLLLNQPHLITDYGQKAQARISEEYSLEKTAEEYQKLYF